MDRSPWVLGHFLRLSLSLEEVEHLLAAGVGQAQDQWRAQMTAISVETEYQEYERIHFVALGNTLPAPFGNSDNKCDTHG